MPKTILQITLVLFLSMTASIVFSQGVAIKNTNSAPNSHSILDIDDSSNSKGILIPRLTTAERTAIAGLGGTEDGLTVYDTDTKTYWLYDGTAWKNFSSGGSGWLLSGNAGTTNGTDYLGTSDNQALDIRTNNIIRARFTTSSQLEILNSGRSVFIGEEAGANDDLVDNDNVAIGYQSLNKNTSGIRNTATGFKSLYENLSGTCNTATGWWALRDNTDDFNSAYGYVALAQNTTGEHNSAFGAGTLVGNLTGNYNTAFGYEALNKNTVSENVAVGYQSLRTNTTGEHNTSVGYKALLSNDDGDDNTAIGYNALTLNDDGIRNTANGYLALSSNVTGDGNTATGWWALRDNTSQFNSAFGYVALAQNTTGSDNLALGASALVNNTTGNQNIAIGNYADVAGNVDNAVAIGYRSQANVANSMVLGGINGVQGVGTNTNVCITTQTPDANANLTLGAMDGTNEGGQITWYAPGSYSTWRTDVNQNVFRIFTYDSNTNTVHIENYGSGSMALEVNGSASKVGGGSWAVYSDKRTKENIVNYNRGLNEILQLRPVNFNYKKEFHFGDKTYTGLIAQEVEKVVPTMVSIHPLNGIDDLREIDPNELTYMLINSVKELNSRNIKIEKENLLLKNQISEIQKQIQDIKKK